MRRWLATAALAVPLAVGLTGCGGGHKAASGAAFNDESNRTLRCMAHQTATPPGSDHPGANEDHESVLAYFHYYTVNGDKRYCDGKPATAVDREWLALYLKGGASRANVTRALSGG